MAIKVVKKPVVAEVEVEKNKTVVSTEKVPVKLADVSKPTASVGFSAAYTKNLGNYESLKITVTLFMPVAIDLSSCKSDIGVTVPEELNSAFQAVQTWVDDKVNAVLDELNQ